MKKMLIIFCLLLFVCSPMQFVKADEGYSNLFISVGDAMMKTKADDWSSVEQLINQLNEDWAQVEQSKSTEVENVDESLKSLNKLVEKKEKQPMLDALIEVSHALVAFEKEQNPVDMVAQRDTFKNALEPVLLNMKTAIDAQSFDEVDKLYKRTVSAWSKNEVIVREQSIAYYGKIETQMGFLRIALSQDEKDFDKISAVTDKLIEAVNAFIAGDELQVNENNYSLQTLIDLLDNASKKIEDGEPKEAVSFLQDFITVWPSVEGEVRTRNGGLYTKLESEIPIIAGKLSSSTVNSDEQLQKIKAHKQSIELLQKKTNYNAWDAALIMLREGLEALLIVASLIAFLRKANAPEKQKWIWTGAFIGLIMSIVAAVLLTILFSSATAGVNRELIEGITGIIAVVMMIGVGIWLHRKSNMHLWNHFINKSMGKALTTGSVLSMAFVSFLAIFREGAETIIFYVGMAPSMSIGSLLTGIAVALALLTVFSFLFIQYSTKIAVGPFFKVATLLIYFLAFKILGVSVHALQLTNHVNTSQIFSLPIISWIGFYPTWQTLIPQVLLIVIILLVAIKIKMDGKQVKAA